MRGFTLLEILVVVLIFGILTTGIFGVLNIGNIIFKDDITLVELQQQARQGMDSLVKEIRESTGIPLGSGFTTITFNIPSEVDCGPGPISYYLGGIDTNNDGVADQIIRGNSTCPTVAKRIKILANDITVLNFSRSGNTVEIQLAAKKNMGTKQLCFPAPCTVPQKTFKEMVKLRNEN